MTLFEVAIVKTTDEKEELLYGPTALIAKCAESARYQAVLECGKGSAEGVDVDALEVLVRPFVS